MAPPTMTAAAAIALPVLLEAAPGKGFAGAMGAPEELGAVAAEEDGNGALVAEL